MNDKLADGAYYYITDHLGAPQIITDDSGSIVWQAEYLPFGNVNISVADIENNLRFPGQYYDAETGLHYNWNRYYDPETGWYIAADPIGLDGGMNLYAYVDGDPINGIDLWGLRVSASFKTVEPTPDPSPGSIDKSPGINTVVCDGSGGISIIFDDPNLQNMNINDAECIIDCLITHEKTHRNQAIRKNPHVCKGQKKYTEILWKNEDLYEREAYNAELECLYRKLIMDCNCEQAVKDRINDIENIILPSLP